MGNFHIICSNDYQRYIRKLLVFVHITVDTFISLSRCSVDFLGLINSLIIK